MMLSTTTSAARTDKNGIPLSVTSHPDNPIPEEPSAVPHLTLLHPGPLKSTESQSSLPSLVTGSERIDKLNVQPKESSPLKPVTHRRRASTVLISQNSEDVQKILGNVGAGTTRVEKLCCGGGCCKLQPLRQPASSSVKRPILPPKNKAFESLQLYLGTLSHDSELTNICELPEKTVSFAPVPVDLVDQRLGPSDHPPSFVQPHPPYEVYRAPLHYSRELTKPGAEKRTFHFDIDITDYPAEGGDVDFVVGGAIGVCPKNADDVVDDIFNSLGVPRTVRDTPR
ncbi:NADPH-cytochrome P450 reductase [Coccidioides immitis RMSCC 3703]|uniref:NADPH-cytochrome P450 reductase n=1 Tax=Coccidioides immitis RMSCC 3703 TaxID=454286 RepID=A0A0J8R9N7_COCIT|nr:NADPH-cytochrome P450 reductase [Coccidioides immitis RMSCC 3703]